MKAAAQTLAAAAPSSRRRQELSRDDLIARGVLVAVMAFLVFFLLAPMAAIFVRAVQDDDGRFVGFAHFAGYFGNTGAVVVALELGLGRSGGGC